MTTCRACERLIDVDPCARCYRCNAYHHDECLRVVESGELFCRSCRDFLGDCPACETAILTEWTSCEVCAQMWHNDCFDGHDTICHDCWLRRSIQCQGCRETFTGEDQHNTSECDGCQQPYCLWCFEEHFICHECWWSRAISCDGCDQFFIEKYTSFVVCERCGSNICAVCVECDCPN